MNVRRRKWKQTYGNANRMIIQQKKNEKKIELSEYDWQEKLQKR